MSATEGTLRKILTIAEKIEANQRERLKLDRERAGRCYPKPLNIQEGAIVVHGDPADTAHQVARNIDHLINPAAKPVPLFPNQEQTDLGRGISKMAADLARRQLEFEANLPAPPTGFVWVRHDKWPDSFDPDRDTNSYVVQTEYSLEPLAGFPFSREEGAR